MTYFVKLHSDCTNNNRNDATFITPTPKNSIIKHMQTY